MQKFYMGEVTGYLRRILLQNLACLLIHSPLKTHNGLLQHLNRKNSIVSLGVNKILTYNANKLIYFS